MEKSNWTYKKAGVDVEAGYEAVEKIKQHAQKTYIPGVMSSLGGFAGLFELPSGYQQPVLVSGTDGVGTKLQLAFMLDKHDTIGIDCVAMCVNDVLCQGAKPLFFLDYIGLGKLNPQQVADVVKGISDGCLQAGCALIGGETAEMPGFYKDNEYDLAGFCVGVVEKNALIDGSLVKEGDVLVGLASSGLHSNGFSLVRKVCFDVHHYQPDVFVDELGQTLGEALLTPTRIYVKSVQAIMDKVTIHGMAHITGGGWFENIPRMFANKDHAAVVHKNSIPVLPIFPFIQKLAGCSDKDMYSTFNMGLGLTLAVDEKDVENVIAIAQQLGETAFVLGCVQKQQPSESKGENVNVLIV